jgi:hypothetical protein
MILFNNPIQDGKRARIYKECYYDEERDMVVIVVSKDVKIENAVDFINRTNKDFKKNWTKKKGPRVKLIFDPYGKA